jgi:hypothetical protein
MIEWAFRRHVGVAAMDQYLGDAPDVGQGPARNDPPRGDPTDEVGRALLAVLQQAAEISTARCERATEAAAKLASELHALEARIRKLEAESFHYRERASRAEEWLQVIQREIEDKLIVPRARSRAEAPA